MGRCLLLASVVLILLTTLILLIQWTTHSMAERFQQTHSPFQSLKGVLMFLLPLPVLIAAIVSLGRGSLNGLIGDAAGYGLFLAGALLLRHGLLSEVEHDCRRVVCAPWLFKILGGMVIALATSVTAWLGAGHHLVIAVAFGLATLLGCYLSYGFDPHTAKRFTDSNSLNTTDRVLETLAQAERSIAAIEQATCDICNAELNGRLWHIVALARQTLSLLKEDPRDLRRARKFLNVYLDGTKQVTEGYAKTHGRVSAPKLENNFRRALVTIEEVFAEQQQKLLESDVSDLDVRIEVLTTQLEREGVV
jgi:5-bromo-4-chloroindolyl phosphate hydrolysis protein